MSCAVDKEMMWLAVVVFELFMSVCLANGAVGVLFVWARKDLRLWRWLPALRNSAATTSGLRGFCTCRDNDLRLLIFIMI